MGEGEGGCVAALSEGGREGGKEEENGGQWRAMEDSSLWLLVFWQFTYLGL